MKCSRCDKTALYRVGANGFCAAHREAAVTAQRKAYDAHRSAQELEKDQHWGSLNMARGGGSSKAADYNWAHGVRY